MAYLYAIAAAHSEVVLYALSVLTGALPRVLALLQRRGFGRGFSGRRRRRGGIFGALGTLLFLLVLGPIVLLALVAYFVYGMLAGRRRR
ncbi:hypothetical protein GBA63_00450 [Rubrobacter tropicus]|uniref:Uncharacterized protein n=1 Tax=Rubrobacter tropicus TaxID=2653851 RepID=A0A6G8Q467_9ACTN|nr:hypothetical protein [Rubrobacter tropicus]QIN81256.1 hypothetical protein GBA63_00450 [Rubrobacter tropicus]